MNIRLCMRPFVPLLAAGSLLMAVSCARTLDEGRARSVLRKLPEFELQKKEVAVTKVVQLDGDHAVVQASVDLTFLLTRSKNRWEVEEIRLDDNQWARIDDLRQALTDQRSLQTRSALLELAQGLVIYFREQGSFPPDSDITALTGLLHPRFLRRLVRTDAWGTEFRYDQLSGGSRYQLQSAGPDRKFLTPDDLYLMDGRFLPAGSTAAE